MVNPTKQSLDPLLNPDDVFDVVTSQFVIHYAFETEKKVRTLLENVSKRLKPQGQFVGTIPNSNWIVCVGVSGQPPIAA